jgi:GDPmannose 4,6-dehydratase
MAFRQKGLTLTWSGSEDKEEGHDQHGNLRVKVNPDFYRPAEVDILCGDATKAETQLGWKRSYSFEALVSEMVNMDCYT